MSREYWVRKYILVRDRLKYLMHHDRRPEETGQMHVMRVTQDA